MKVTRALQATAYQEAGHAVAGWYVGIEAKNLSIVPDADSLGHYEHAPYRTALVDSDSAQEVEKAALVSLAGPATVRRFGYRAPRPSGQADRHGDHSRRPMRRTAPLGRSQGWGDTRPRRQGLL